MKTQRKLAIVAAVTATLMTVVGCVDILGGGWIDSATGAGAKATFGFDFDCRNTSRFGTDSAVGSITYHDHGLSAGTFNPIGVTPKFAKNAVAIQGLVTRPEGLTYGLDWCVNNGVYGSYYGTYTPIPPGVGAGGAMYVVAVDGGEQGPDKDDFLAIRLVGGVFDGYENAGSLRGGNITMP